MRQTMHLVFDTVENGFSNINEINSSFASGSLVVMYSGQNRNGSSISRQAIESALPSLKNVPIVCHWDYENNTIGGHDIDLVKGNNGSLYIRTLTEPCGVVPDHASFRFEDIQTNDGTNHECLVIDGVLLWKRQDVYNHIKNDLGGKVKHSMEITINDGFIDDSGVFVIRNFEFTALCLLERDDPCFENSALTLFSESTFTKKMHEMMQDMKKSFSKIDTPVGDDDIHPQISAKGGEKVLEEKMKLAADYGIDVSTLEFSIDEMSIEELAEKFEAMKAAEPEPAAEAEAAEDTAEDFALDRNVREELERALRVETVKREWGEYPRYCMWDYDAELSEVYAWDDEDWLLYGFAYTMDGDAVTIQFETKKRMKIVVAPFEGEQASPFATVFAQMSEKIAANAEWEAKYQTASEAMATMETELGELRTYKANVEQAEADAKAKAERDAVFAKFGDLEGNEAFEALKNDCAGIEIDVLEEKCYALRGRFGTNVKFSYEPKAPKFVVDKTKEDSDEPYGGLMLKYGNRSKD